MEYIPSIVSLIFLLGALVPLYWGFHTIKLNLQSSINRTFLLLCIALSIWSFGFAMTSTSKTMEVALLWRRFSAIGWTFIISIILHFLLLISNQKNGNKFPKYMLGLHIPAMLVVYVFAVSNKMAMSQYNLVKTAYGWTNIAVNNGWDYFYYIYFSIYMTVSLLVVWRWKSQLKEAIKIRQAKLVFAAILFAAIPGGLIDLVANTFLVRPLPQMAPLFILLPVWTMYHSVRYYDLLNIKKVTTEEKIISSDQQKNMFISFSIGICISGILAFVFEYMSSESVYNGDFKKSLIKGSTLMVLGLSLFFIQRIQKEKLKERLTAGILLSSIPIVTFQFLNYSTITVWVYPIIIIISSLLFTKRILLTLATIMAIITQRLVWILRPESYVLVDKYDFILRIGMFIVAFFLGWYINQIYIAKMKQNKDQIAFQNMVSEVLFEFVSFNEDSFDIKVNYLLEKIGTFFNVDRTYLFTINHNNDTMTYSNEWCNTGVSKEVGTIDKIPLSTFPWWVNELSNKNLVNIEDVDSMPKQASAEQKQLHRQEVKSLLAVPVRGRGKVYAFIGIDSISATQSWSQDKIEMLNIMANILSSAITPIKADEETEYMAYYDSLTKLPNRFLFADKVNQEIHRSKGTGGTLSIIFIDLDGFKSVNDTIGHRGEMSY